MVMRVAPGLVSPLIHRRNGIGMLSGMVLAGTALLGPTGQAEAQAIPGAMNAVTQNLAHREQGDHFINSPAELLRVLVSKVRTGDPFIKRATKRLADVAQDEYDVLKPGALCTVSILPGAAGGLITAFNLRTQTSLGQSFDGNGKLSGQYNTIRTPAQARINKATPDVYRPLDRLLNECIEAVFEESA